MSGTAVRADAPAVESTGTAVGRVGGTLLVLEHYWSWYRRHWRITLLSNVLLPATFLLAMGLGLGSVGNVSQITGGRSYLVYVAPAFLVVAAMQIAVGEASYPVLSGFKWQKSYWAMTATPINPEQVAIGTLAWIGVRLSLVVVAFVLVSAVVGAVAGPGIVLSMGFAVLSGLAFAAPIVAYAATIKGEGYQFNVVFRLIFLPMMLFAGTFYPISQLPAVARPIAWITPMWHGVQLSRAAELGPWQWWPAIGHLAYLCALLAVGAVLSCRTFRTRLVV